jgi:hypothetical protein
MIIECAELCRCGNSAGTHTKGIFIVNLQSLDLADIKDIWKNNNRGLPPYIKCKKFIPKDNLKYLEMKATGEI